MSLQNTMVVLVLGLTLGGKVQTGKIIGGREAVPHSRPYMVLLERKLSNGETSYCDGFLVSDEFVLTAAHCQASIYYVHVGLHEFINDQTPKGIGVIRAIRHEHYNEKMKTNDVMLLKLSEKVQFTEHVRQIQFAGQPVSLPQNCIVSGWGYSDNGPYMASKLREVNVTVVDSERCAAHRTYCSVGETGPAQGDSGGPLVCENELAFGIVSFKTRSHPIIYVFAKIPDYFDWIERNMKSETKMLRC